MTDSSGNRLGLVAKLEVKQIQHLLRVLSQSTLRGPRFVEKVFLEQARNFVETCQFLQDMDWIEDRGKQLFLTKAGVVACELTNNDEQLRSHLLEKLSNQVNPYRRDLANYLGHFSLSGTQLAYRPSVSERTKQSPMRDFLMNMRVVTYRATDDTYLIEPNAADLYIWAINYRSPSRKAFQGDAIRKADLGLAAETAVFEHERMRVGSQWMHCVEHVSSESPFACYDIKSVTIEGEHPIPRYIEVKAVSGESYQFYWSRIELEAAQLLHSKYFLYLLPVSVGGNFDLERMLVINDPHKSVYQNPNAWRLEQDAVICNKRAEIEQAQELTSSSAD